MARKKRWHAKLAYLLLFPWGGAVAADVASLWLGSAAWQLAYLLNIIGIAVMLPTITIGIVDQIRLPEGDALRRSYFHLTVVISSVIFFACRLLQPPHSGFPQEPNLWSFIFDGLGLICLGYGYWMGLHLFYKNKKALQS